MQIPALLERSQNTFRLDFFPIVISVTSLDQIGKVAKAMGRFVPISPVDYAPVMEYEGLQKAYDILITWKDRSLVDEFWDEPWWKKKGLESFGKRLSTVGKGEIKVVFWIRNSVADRTRYAEIMNKVAA